MTPKNIDYIKAMDPRLAEALESIAAAHNNLAQQTNGNSTGQPQAPPAVNGVQVSGRDGFLHVAITDNGAIYRGIRYYAEHADNPNFIDPIVVPMHDSRNATIPVGNQARYVRVYSAYPWSPISPAVYHGGAQPIAVSGGGSTPGPRFLSSQGSGTGPSGTGLQGPGRNPFRSTDGAPPTR